MILMLHKITEFHYQNCKFISCDHECTLRCRNDGKNISSKGKSLGGYTTLGLVKDLMLSLYVSVESIHVYLWHDSFT